jgi:FixJ family two-component response regulator
VNVSPLQFLSGDLARHVHSALHDTGADPHQLGLEVTESSLMHDPEQAARMLRELKSLGIEISLDDFGTGYSSLSCLRSLPIDVVKIDRSFVNDITAAPESASVTRSIITMSHGLQMKVLAEGVETEAQLALLLAKGCDQIQGYWFSRPVSAEALAELLRQGHSLPQQLTRQRSRQRTLLLVDDEENILASLKRLFRRDGYQILTATSGADGLRQLAACEVDVIVSDQRMPGMTGVDFLRQAKQLYPDTIRMTLSGYADLQSIIDAVNEGAVYKFLTKPWEDVRLREHVAQAFTQKELADDNRRLTDEVSGANTELARLNHRLEQMLTQQRDQSGLLQASAGGIRGLLDDLPLAVLGIDPEGLLVYANLQAQRLLPPEHLALGLPMTTQVEALRDTLAATDHDTPGPAQPVMLQQQAAWAWRTSIHTGEQPARGEMLVLMPHLPPPPPTDTARS